MNDPVTGSEPPPPAGHYRSGGALAVGAAAASLTAGVLGWSAPLLWGPFVRYGWTVYDGYFLTVTGMIAAALLFLRYRSVLLAAVLAHGVAMILFLALGKVIRWALTPG